MSPSPLKQPRSGFHAVLSLQASQAAPAPETQDSAWRDVDVLSRSERPGSHAAGEAATSLGSGAQRVARLWGS